MYIKHISTQFASFLSDSMRILLILLLSTLSSAAKYDQSRMDSGGYYDNRRITQDRNYGSRHNVLCYSCMSKFYESSWKLLSNVYVQPVNFSDACNFAHETENAQKNIGLVRCPSVCIKMYERAQIGGFHVNGFIRGCYDNLLQHGWNETIVQWYRWLARDSCKVYSRKHILKLSPNSPEGKVTICTCYADGCNGSPRLSGATAITQSWFALAVATLSLLLVCRM